MKNLMRPLVAGVLAAGALAATATAATAAAPTGRFAPFNGCPYNNAAVTGCLYSVTKSGSFKLGNANVPINKPITFQGGYSIDINDFSTTFYPAANGQPTLSKTPLDVPGGLLGLMDTRNFGGPLLQAFQNAVKQSNAVTATAELVGPAKFDYINFLFQDGVAVTLPTRIKLDNPFLGPNCYVGSASNPVTFRLTTGTTNPPRPNTPIKGTAGTISTSNDGLINFVRGDSLVDNAFAVPAASDCGYLPLDKLLITGAVNLKEGFPSAAGKNSAILNGDADIADANAVRASVR